MTFTTTFAKPSYHLNHLLPFYTICSQIQNYAQDQPGDMLKSIRCCFCVTDLSCPLRLHLILPTSSQHLNHGRCCDRCNLCCKPPKSPTYYLSMHTVQIEKQFHTWFQGRFLGIKLPDQFVSVKKEQSMWRLDLARDLSAELIKPGDYMDKAAVAQLLSCYKKVISSSTS